MVLPYRQWNACTALRLATRPRRLVPCTTRVSPNWQGPGRRNTTSGQCCLSLLAVSLHPPPFSQGSPSKVLGIPLPILSKMLSHAATFAPSSARLGSTQPRGEKPHGGMVQLPATELFPLASSLALSLSLWTNTMADNPAADRQTVSVSVISVRGFKPSSRSFISFLHLQPARFFSKISAAPCEYSKGQTLICVFPF